MSHSDSAGHYARPVSPPGHFGRPISRRGHFALVAPVASPAQCPGAKYLTWDTLLALLRQPCPTPENYGPRVLLGGSHVDPLNVASSPPWK